MMYTDPEIQAEIKHRRLFAAGTNRALVRACAWCGRALTWWSAIRMALGAPAASHGICKPCAERLTNESGPATDATVTRPERSGATRAPAPPSNIGGTRG